MNGRHPHPARKGAPTSPAGRESWTGRRDRPVRRDRAVVTGSAARVRQRHAVPLETVSVDVPEAALEAYEAALSSACATVGFFRDQAGGIGGSKE